MESTRETCDEPSAEDQLLYVLNKTQPADRCCPTYRRTACLVDGGAKSFRAGDSWPSDDPCVTWTCVEETDGQLIHQKIIAACPAPSCDQVKKKEDEKLDDFIVSCC